MTKFPEPPDSLAKYVADIKFVILLKTVLLIMAIGGISNFYMNYVKKIVYIFKYRIDKIFSFKQIFRLLGMTTFLIYFVSELKISPIYDSYFMKLRIILSCMFVMMLTNLIMPIHSYRSMIRTEFLTLNLAFISYTLTYPRAYFVLLHLFYEIIILVSIYIIVNNL